MNLFLIVGFLGLYVLSQNFFFSYSLSIYSKEWMRVITLPLDFVIQLVADSISHNIKESLIPVISTVFVFVLINNVVGLIPYSFTGTSHMFVTLFLSFSLFLGINFLLLEKYELVSFSLFIPGNSDVLLALLLVPIEFVSYIVRPVSLGVRLFANLMSGHTLIKVIAGFAWTLLLVKGLASLIFLVPGSILLILFVLEFAVALIQTYVFSLLICIYIEDVK